MVSLTQWSPVGSRLVYFTTEFKAMAVPTEGGTRAPQALTDTTEFMGMQMISPDGRWLASVMGDLPNIQIFAQSLTGPAARWQISTAPAFNPRWTKGGRELIYEGMDGRLMSTSIDIENGFHAGTPVFLFQLPRSSPALDVTSWTCDDAGARFFVLTAQRSRTPGVIDVVTNFHGLVSRK